MGLWDTVNLLGMLLVGREPEWVEQAATTGAPTSANDGVPLQDSPVAFLSVAMREEVIHRIARVTVSVLDLTDTYTVTIDGNNVDFDALAGGAVDLEDVIEGIRDAINADPVVSLIVVAEGVDADGDTFLDTVKITGLAEPDYTIDISTAGGGALACAADATDADLRVWGWPGGARRDQATTAPNGWKQIAGETFASLDYRGCYLRLERPVAGFTRLYVELFNVAGAGDGPTVTYDPTAHVGYSVQE
jgi:hypothetical protein